MDAKFILRVSNGREYPVNTSLRIGREADCQILLNDPRVSRLHAIVSVEGNSLIVQDQNSSNGTFVNGKQITGGQPWFITVGDQLQIGDTSFTVIAAQASEPLRSVRPSSSPSAIPKQRPSTLPVYLLGCMILLLFITAAGSALFLSLGGVSLIPSSSGRAALPTAGAARVITSSAPPTAVAPQTFAALNDHLTSAIADLNRAQLKFINDSKTTSALRTDGLAKLTLQNANLLDDDLREIAAQGMKVGLLATELGSASAAQENGDKLTEQYAGIARLSYALVIDAQNMRDGLKNKAITPASASSTVTEYGARLWNPAASEPAKGNPFASTLKDTSAAAPTISLNPAAAAQIKNQNPQTWIAASSETTTKTINIPPPTKPISNPFDKTLLAKMTTASAQADANTARQIAAAQLGVKGNTVQVALFKGVAVAGSNQLAAGVVPSFDKGTASALFQRSGASNDPSVDLLTLFGADPPAVNATVPIQSKPPVVTLTISNITIKEVRTRSKDAFQTFEADVVYEFDVQWQTNIGSPKIPVECTSSNQFEITSQSGSRRIQARGLLILYPGTETAYCYADLGGISIGNASVSFLVGNAQGATARANQVETDSVALNITLTADAVGTLYAQRTQEALATQNAAQTQASLSTQHALETQQSLARTAEFRATITQIAKKTQDADANAIFTMNGTFGLRQSDSGCTFSIAPYTSGTFKITVDFGKGTVTGSLDGGGGGTRGGLSCGSETGDLVWSQSYTGTFGGTVDATSGAISASGTVTGRDSYSIRNCKRDGESVQCDPGGGKGYQYPFTLSGTANKTTRSSKGTWIVQNVGLPTSGDWQAGQ